MKYCDNFIKKLISKTKIITENVLSIIDVMGISEVICGGDELIILELLGVVVSGCSVVVFSLVGAVSGTLGDGEPVTSDTTVVSVTDPLDFCEV